LLWLSGPEEFLGLLRNRPLVSNTLYPHSQGLRMYHYQPYLPPLHLKIRLSILNRKDQKITLLYYPLSSLFSAASFPRLILGGDFNCSGFDWSCDHQYGNCLDACEQALLEVSVKYGLSQHVHSTSLPSSGRLLDQWFLPHILQSSRPAMLCLVLATMTLYCLKLTCLLGVLRNPHGKYCSITKLILMACMRSYLSLFVSTYRESYHVHRSVDDNWNIIAEGIKEAINYIPHKMSKAKRYLPWVSPAIKHLMNKRDRAYKRAKHTGHRNAARTQKRL